MRDIVVTMSVIFQAAVPLHHPASHPAPAHGGWRLARPAAAITVADIYRALDEPFLNASPLAPAPHGTCAIEAAMAAIDGPVVLVAHSGGCVMVAHWAHTSAHAQRVVGALLGPLSRQTHIAPSRVLLPLSYAAILGGVTTLVGTSTNLVDWEAFGLMMDLAMMGCGTGAIELPHEPVHMRDAAKAPIGIDQKPGRGAVSYACGRVDQFGRRYQPDIGSAK